MSEKLKGFLSPLKPTKNRVIMLVIWFFYGIIVDLILQLIVLFTSNGAKWGRLEVGFKFYMGHDYTGIAYDDIILLAISIVLILTKNVYKGFGFFLGFYVSSCLDFYGKLNLPRPEG